MPTVSVIVPTFNSARYLPAALESILAQTYRDYEIIVVDDGSTDQTRQLLTTYNGRLIVLTQEHGGVSSARNLGIQKAQGRYIAFLDADDVWLPQKLKYQTDYLNAHPSVALLYCYARYRDEKGERHFIRPTHVSKTFSDFLYQPTVLPTPTVMVRRQCLEKTGGFNTALPGIEDYDLWLRIARHYTVEFIPKVMVEIRLHTDSLSHNELAMYNGYVGVFEYILHHFANDIDRQHIIRRLARTYYLRGRQYSRQGLWQSARRDCFRALQHYPAVGRLFWETTDGRLTRVYKLVKPYLFFLLSSGKAAFAKNENRH